MNSNELKILENILTNISDTRNQLKKLEDNKHFLSNELKIVKNKSEILAKEIIKVKEIIKNNTDNIPKSFDKEEIKKKCIKFLNEKDKLISSNNFKTHFKIQNDIINDINKTNAPRDDKDYESSLLGYIYFKYKVESYNKKKNFDSTCNKIIDMSHIEKMYDNSSKYLFSDIIKNLYVKDIIDNQSGGSSSNNNTIYQNLSQYIDKIVDKQYIATLGDQKIQKQIKHELSDIEKCIGTTYFDTEDTTSNGQEFMCFRSMYGMNKKTMRKNFIYFNFKKKFNQEFTDRYIRDYLGDNMVFFSEFCNYIYFALDLSLRCLIKSHNKKYNKHLEVEDLHIMYKGGNTTRMILRNYFRQIKKIINSNDNTDKPSITNSNIEMDNCINNSLLGDFDFNVSVDYITLKRKFGNEWKQMLNDIEIFIEQTVSIALQDIKNTITQFLYSNYQSDLKFSKILDNTIMKNNDFKNDLDKFVVNYNTYYGNNGIYDKNKDIGNINVVKIETYESTIFPDRIEEVNNTLNIKNRVLYPGTEHNKKELYTSNNMIEVDNFYKYKDNTNSFLPEENVKNSVYNIYLKNFNLVKRYTNDVINLYRTKINNKLYFTINGGINGGVPKEITINVPIEIVDVSVRRAIATGNYHYRYLNSNRKHCYENCFITRHNKLKFPLLIPSADYLYNDISIMLFDNSIYTWSDKKYEKRIYRLFLLLIVCYAEDSGNANANVINIRNNFIQLKRKFLEFINLNNPNKTPIEKLKEKIIFIINKYNPDIQDYDILKYDDSIVKVYFPKIKMGGIDFYFNNILEKHINQILCLYHISDQSFDIIPNIDSNRSTKYNDFCKNMYSPHKLVEDPIHAKILANGNNNAVYAFETFFELKKNYKEDYVNLEKYENTIIKLCDTMIVILTGYIDGGIVNLPKPNTNYDNLY